MPGGCLPPGRKSRNRHRLYQAESRARAEEAELETLNYWLAAGNLPRGHLAFDHAGPATGAQAAVFDLARPDGSSPG